MGIYIYSMRAKTINLAMPSGVKVKANMYCYAYKMHSMWPGDYGYNSYRMVADNTSRNADNAFQSTSGVAIVGEVKDGIVGCSVYSDVSKPTWCDVDGFPGKLIGWVQKSGRGYRVADRTDWTTSNSRMFREDPSGDVLLGDARGRWISVNTRYVMIDGIPTREERDAEPVSNEITSLA